MSRKIPASLGMLTRNSGKTLRRALESVRDFDDIIICDGGSTDDTLAIAREFGAHILEQRKEFLDADGRLFDYGGARNQTLDAAKHNWFFFLDSDEECDTAMVDAIQDVVAVRGEEGEGAFWVDRKYVLEGTLIDCAATYPNRQMRFFARRSAHRFVKQVHERIQLKEGVRAEILSGTMYLPFPDDLMWLRKKWGYQIQVEVERRGIVTLSAFIREIGKAGKVSLLWLFRLVRNFFFCRGTKMPLKYEMERHYFHLRLLYALWKEVKFK